MACIEAEGLTVDWILETHAHADHLTAAPLLKARTVADERPAHAGERGGFGAFNVDLDEARCVDAVIDQVVKAHDADRLRAVVSNSRA